MTTTLSASRELDALIAEKVFDLSTRQWHGDLAITRGDETYFHPLPYYSTSIEAAWQVVEHSDHHVQVRRLWVKAWDAWQWVAEFGLVSGEGDTAPLAICRAALAAVGHDS